MLIVIEFGLIWQVLCPVIYLTRDHFDMEIVGVIRAVRELCAIQDADSDSKVYTV